MTEVELDFPRAWIEFMDPADEAQVIRADLTWLTSSWSCIFGAGCHGIDAAVPFAGCCTLGAHFADRDDRRRVGRMAKELTAEDWQLRAEGRRDGIVDTDEDGQEKTRVLDGACIFLNRPGFAAGAGCALHALALRTGRSIVETKPDVCWQLPIHRSFREIERADHSTYLEVTVTEYDRRAWGPGGHDLDWYCSGSPEAHVGAAPVFESSAEELRALLGEAAYRELARHCRDHLHAKRRLRHPASPAGRRGRAR